MRIIGEYHPFLLEKTKLCGNNYKSFFSGMPIYLPTSIYDNFIDLFRQGNIGLDIARHAERRGTLVPARLLLTLFILEQADHNIKLKQRLYTYFNTMYSLNLPSFPVHFLFLRSNDIGEVLMHKIVDSKGSALFAKEGVSLYKSSYMQQGKDFPFYVIPERFEILVLTKVSSMPI